MAIPTTRDEFKEFCKRKLGTTVINLQVSEEQIDDRVDEALSFYWDYHFDGADKDYYKFQVTANSKPDAIYDVTVSEGGTGYANTDTVVFTSDKGANAAATIVTDANGSITQCTLSNNGINYAIAPTVSVTSNTGSGAVLTAELGGFIPLPENIIGAIRIFPYGEALSTNNIFSIRYQIALNDLYTLTSASMVPYYSAFQHIRLIEQILVGQQPIRYSRHRDRVYIDMDWYVLNPGEFLIVEAYKIVDPITYPDVWKDRWLQSYCTALIKKQLGENTKRYGNMTLPGGVAFNGQIIFDEAVQEIEKWESDLIESQPVMPSFMMG
jgi:hypothetical protein